MDTSPRGCYSLSDQILRSARRLYDGPPFPGSQWAQVDEFLRSLGFQACPLDSSFYRRQDKHSWILAVISIHFDDFRVVAPPSTLQELDNAFFAQFPGYVRGQFAVSGYAFRL